MKLVLPSLLLLATVMFSIPSQANLVFSPAFFYKNYEDKTNSTRNEVTETYYDIKLGYVMTSGLYLGGLYSAMTREINENEVERTSYGAGVGYYSNGWFLMGHYVIDSEYETSPGNKHIEGSGFQLDVGHWFNVSSQIYVGPQLTYRSISYDKYQTNSTTVSLEMKSTEFLPYISLALMF